jgi:hypothetical protein
MLVAPSVRVMISWSDIMPQTPEDRIRLQYKALRRSRATYEFGTGWMWLRLARQWKRPVQEIKQVVGKKK